MRPTGKPKRYYWLKLERDFFKSKVIKKLRKQAGGDTYTIIVLELALMSLEHDGIIAFEGVEDNITDEIALELDEEPGNVRVALEYLQKCGWLEVLDDDALLLHYVAERTGSETDCAARQRKRRERLALQCHADVTPLSQNCNDRVRVEVESEKSNSQSKRESVEYSRSCEKTELFTGYSTEHTLALPDTSKIKGAISYYSLAFGHGECPSEVQSAMVYSGLSNQELVEFMKDERCDHEDDMGEFLIRKLEEWSMLYQME